MVAISHGEALSARPLCPSFAKVGVFTADRTTQAGRRGAGEGGQHGAGVLSHRLPSTDGRQIFMSVLLSNK